MTNGNPIATKILPTLANYYRGTGYAIEIASVQLVDSGYLVVFNVVHPTVVRCHQRAAHVVEDGAGGFVNKHEIML